MKKQEQKQIISLDQFDETVSLYQLIPPGAGRGLSHLKTIVNSILHNPEQQQVKPLSLLLIGKQGCRTHGRSFTRALGLEYISESPGQLLNAPTNAVHDFFNPLLLSDSYLISDINMLYPSVLKILYQIMTKGQYSLHNHLKNAKEIVSVYNPIVMTAPDISKIPGYFKEQIDHIVSLENYGDQSLELVVLQRLKYCGIDYDEEKVLSLIVAYGHKNLHKIIRLLKSSITVIMSENRTTLTVADVKKVMGYS